MLFLIIQHQASSENRGSQKLLVRKVKNSRMIKNNIYSPFKVGKGDLSDNILQKPFFRGSSKYEAYEVQSKAPLFLSKRGIDDDSYPINDPNHS